MRYVFSITFFMINGIIQAQKLVSQVYYLDQCQKYNNTIKKEAPTTWLQYWVKLGSIMKREKDVYM